MCDGRPMRNLPICLHNGQVTIGCPSNVTSSSCETRNRHVSQNIWSHSIMLSMSIEVSRHTGQTILCLWVCTCACSSRATFVAVAATVVAVDADVVDADVVAFDVVISAAC